MKKLMTFCFILLFSVLSILSCVNFNFYLLDQIEKDKIGIVINKPEDITNIDFLMKIDKTLGDTDIMFRFIETGGVKAHYKYYITSHTNDFININTSINDKNSEYISTIMQDISIYTWTDAEQYDLSSATYYIKINQQSTVIKAIRQLGYTVTVNYTAYVSGQFSVLLFSFIPAFMLIASIVFYTLSIGKKSVLKKMEGYTTYNILFDEIKQIFPAFLVMFLIIEVITLIIAVILYKSVMVQFILFSIKNIIILFLIILIGLSLSYLIAFRQKSTEYIKGRVPRRGIYIITIFAKGIFVVFIIFFMSIAIRNAIISYNTIQTSQFIADKVNGYVTIPVNQNNTSVQSQNYKDFYLATVNKYNGILIDASNYEYHLISGSTSAEEFGQTYITINNNYLGFNPIYDLSGHQITDTMLSDTKFNVLIPASKENEKEQWSKLVKNAYSMETNFITYNNVSSKIYSYNADIGTEGYGVLYEPVILVVDEEQLEGIYVLSYCSKGAYFLNVPSKNPYQELLPILKQTGIAPTTPDTPSISETFLNTLNHHKQMLILYGTQSFILLIGLICLILFSAKMYCENSKNKIACCLIEGYSLFHCIKNHLIITVFYYICVIVALCFVSMFTQVSLNYMILIVSFIGELIITFITSKRLTKNNLYQIVKGAD